MYSVYGTTTRFALTTLTLTSVLSLPAMADDSQRIDQLEQRLDSMQKQMTESSLEKVRLNGFFSTGYTRANNDAGYDDATEKSDLETLSLFGLQSTFALGRNTEAVLQLVSRGKEDWDTELEWGYLRHQFSNSSELRAGKMRLPLFMESETLEIGYGQPWARPKLCTIRSRSAAIWGLMLPIPSTFPDRPSRHAPLPATSTTMPTPWARA